MHLRCSRLFLLTRAGAAVCGCALMLAGCGKSGSSLGKLVPVQGKVTRVDGKPLTGGRVTFMLIDSDPKTPSPTPMGPIGEDGSYTLSTEGKPGAPLGKYRVMLTRPSDPKMRFEMLSAIPQQYLRRDSPLEVEVTENKPAGGYELKLQNRKGNPRGKER